VTTTFLDIPVYRLPRDEYYRQRDTFVEKALHPGVSGTFFEQHLIDVFGGCWEFNEIIGYIRLHFLGGQVRGEYFAVNRKRIVRTRHKQLEYVSHKLAPEVEIEMPVTDQTVEAAVRQYLQDCQRELPRRYVDIEGFTVLAPYIRWHDLWATENPFGPKRAEVAPSPHPARRWPRRPRRRES
jgi:hypothetical protein